MNSSIFNKLKSLRNRYEEIEIMLSQKDTISNQENFKNLSKEYLKISEIVKNFIKWEKLESDIKKH